MANAGENQFTTRVEWTGNTGQGTASYTGYTRNWNIAAPGKPVIPCSNDPELGGDPTLMNPEDRVDIDEIQSFSDRIAYIRIGL